MKNFISKSTVTLLLLVLFTAVFMPRLNVSAAPDGGAALTIIHTNDRHGRMGADPYISQLAREIEGNVLILDAGDALHGQIATNLTDGAAMVELMNAVGYSAMVTGNHDFTFGIERMLELAEMMDFPLLAANVKNAAGESVFQQYAVFPMEGLTVGVFGLATPETIEKADPRVIAGLVFENPAATAEAMVSALKNEGCDIIIALAHLGVDEASTAANRSSGALAAVPGIDVIIDGHSHTELENGLISGDTLIAQTGEHGQFIGVVEITVSGGEISKTASLLAVPANGEESNLIADAEITAEIAALEAANEAITSVVIGSAPVPLDGERANVRAGETNLANLISDSMTWATGADVALLTGGNIRASIPEGDITMGHVLNTLPFSNLLVTVELPGAELLAVLEHGVSQYPEQAGQHIQISGLRFEFDPNAEPGNRVTSVTMADGGAFDTAKTYTVATIEFIAAGGDGYTMFANSANLIYYGGDAEAFADYLATGPAINAEAENRVKAAASTESQTETAEPIVEITEKPNPNTGDYTSYNSVIFALCFSILAVVCLFILRKRFRASNGR